MVEWFLIAFAILLGVVVFVVLFIFVVAMIITPTVAEIEMANRAENDVFAKVAQEEKEE